MQNACQVQRHRASYLKPVVYRASGVDTFSTVPGCQLVHPAYFLAAKAFCSNLFKPAQRALKCKPGLYLNYRPTSG